MSVSSVVSGIIDPRLCIDWLPITREQVLKEGPNASIYTIYAAEKALAEKAVWDFVDKHPHVEMTASKSFEFYYSVLS